LDTGKKGRRRGEGGRGIKEREEIPKRNRRQHKASALIGSREAHRVALNKYAVRTLGRRGYVKDQIRSGRCGGRLIYTNTRVLLYHLQRRDH